LASSCVCMALVTPSRYPNSVAVTALTATLPEPLEASARDAVKLPVVIVLTAPAILLVRLVSAPVN
jgi:hypothetical protein